MFHIILYQPEIPPNTGNVIRLCANTGCQLHLIEPLGFKIDDAQVKRAGLDYHHMAAVHTYKSLTDCLSQLPGSRLLIIETVGSVRHSDCQFQAGDAFLFGPETRGLPTELLAEYASAPRLAIPMRAGNRSLNLSNSVAVVVFEAWRQLGFAGG
jgi:tRNA (cytidine/uridine-2'-O-)-methyltransferase